MTKACLILLAFAATSNAQTLCQPNYQITHSACMAVPNGRMRDVSIENVEVNPGACNKDNLMNLCRDKIKVIAEQNPGALNIVPTNPQTSALIAPMCQFPDKPRFKVTCNFSFQMPETTQVVDDSCPVENIRDANGCFENASAEIDPSLVTGCLSSKPKTDAELYTKAVCLSDLDRAAKSFRVTLNAGVLDKVEGQLEAIKGLIRSKGRYQNLSDLLQKQ